MRRLTLVVAAALAALLNVDAGLATTVNLAPSRQSLIYAPNKTTEAPNATLYTAVGPLEVSGTKENRGLYGFDLTPLTASGYVPGTHQITKLTLTLNPKSNTASQGGPVFNLLLNAIDTDSANWVDGNFSPSSTFTAWNLETNTPSTAWATTGFGDAPNAAIATLLANSLASVTYTYSATLPKPSIVLTSTSGATLTTMVDTWLTAGKNAGLVLSSDSASGTGYQYLIISRGGVTGAAPALSLEYEAIPEPGSLSLLLIGLAGLGRFVRRKGR